MTARHAMSHADAAWLRMDRPTNLMVINALTWFDEPPDWDRLQATFTERIVERFPRFRQLARAGGPLGGGSWEDDPHFDARDHFHRIALPAPHDEAALQALVGDLASLPLSRERPLWELFLIDDFNGGAAVLMRVHHAVGDGVSLARVLLTAADDGDPGPGFGNHRGGGLTAAVKQAAGVAAHPRRAAERAATDIGALAKLLLPGGERSQVLKSDGSISHRVAWCRPVELWRVKRAARAYRVKVNDVLMAALSGALRARIAAAGEQPERLHALVPLNLRPLDEPLPEDLGNRFGLVLADLPVEVEDSIDRLWEVNRVMEQIKRSDESALTFGILGLLGRSPGPVESWLIEYVTAKASMVVTNVIGPSKRISLAGTPIAGVLVWAPCSGDLRMTVSLFSYAGKVHAGFLTDAEVLPDPQPLADAFRAELLALARRAP